MLINYFILPVSVGIFIAISKGLYVFQSVGSTSASHCEARLHGESRLKTLRLMLLSFCLGCCFISLFFTQNDFGLRWALSSHPPQLCRRQQPLLALPSSLSPAHQRTEPASAPSRARRLPAEGPGRAGRAAVGPRSAHWLRRGEWRRRQARDGPARHGWGWAVLRSAPLRRHAAGPAAPAAPMAAAAPRRRPPLPRRGGGGRGLAARRGLRALPGRPGPAPLGGPGAGEAPCGRRRAARVPQPRGSVPAGGCCCCCRRPLGFCFGGSAKSRFISLRLSLK